MTGGTAQLRSVVEQVSDACDVIVEEMEVRRLGQRSLVKVVIDRENGVDVDLSARVARELRNAIESTPELTNLDFVLEVSSRGIDRPLTEPRHWRRNKGRQVELVLADGALTGRIAAVDDSGVEVDTEDGGGRRISFEDVVRAVVLVEFSGPPAKGGG